MSRALQVLERTRGQSKHTSLRFQVTRHTSHVTRHTSHVTRHTSHVTRHTSHVTRHTSHVTRHTSTHDTLRSALLYLSTWGNDFEGGELVFLGRSGVDGGEGHQVSQQHAARQTWYMKRACNTSFVTGNPASCWSIGDFLVWIRESAQGAMRMTRHTSHVTRHSSLVTRHTSHVTRCAQVNKVTRGQRLVLAMWFTCR